MVFTIKIQLNSTTKGFKIAVIQSKFRFYMYLHELLFIIISFKVTQ